jgi:hypothetical protein
MNDQVVSVLSSHGFSIFATSVAFRHEGGYFSPKLGSIAQFVSDDIIAPLHMKLPCTPHQQRYYVCPLRYWLVHS